MSKKYNVFVSAGDAITARLVEEAGFDGIWVSGFEASARLGLADNGSITLTEMLNVAKPIVEATKLPVFVDVDTGYGNIKRTIKEFTKIGVRGICIEDNNPNKENSLWGGSCALYPVVEFADKIESVKDREITVIARTEALIRGHGMIEATRRGCLYADAGADIVLIHTRKQCGSEAIAIPKEWRKLEMTTPLAIVPTKFPKMTNEELGKLGYSIIIWANQTERVKIKSIRDALKIMKDQGCGDPVEGTLSASLDDMRNLMPEE